MKCYGQEFMVDRICPSPYPTKAQTWESLEQAVSQYEEFVADCENTEYTPSPHWLYLGKPDGDETMYGYPDVFDYIIRVGPRGKVIVEDC